MKPAPLARPVGIRRMVTLCAWCPPAIVKAQTAALHRMGHCVSHGICPECAARVRGEAVAASQVKSAIVPAGAPSLGMISAPGALAFHGIETPTGRKVE